MPDRNMGGYSESPPEKQRFLGVGVPFIVLVLIAVFFIARGWIRYSADSVSRSTPSK